MYYKKFGIYSNDNYVCVVIDFHREEMLYVRFPTTQFKELSNGTINIILEFEYLMVTKDDLFMIDLSQNPIFFEENDYGYLGKINSNSLRKEITEFINKLIVEN